MSDPAGGDVPGEPPPRAVVAAHGDLAVGLVSAVAQITGRGDRFVPLSNRGLGREQLEATLRDLVDATGTRLVFTDLPAGSWTLAARRLQRERPELVVVTGVNLAMLLDSAFRDDEPAEAVALSAVEKGQGAMLVSGGAGVH